MAIDTRNKRASAIGIGLPFRAAYPAPDSTIDASDRLHVAFLYSGIAAGAGAEPQYYPTRFLQGTFTRIAALIGSKIGQQRITGTIARIARLPGGGN